VSASIEHAEVIKLYCGWQRRIDLCDIAAAYAPPRQPRRKQFLSKNMTTYNHRDGLTTAHVWGRYR